MKKNIYVSVWFLFEQNCVILRIYILPFLGLASHFDVAHFLESLLNWCMGGYFWCLLCVKKLYYFPPTPQWIVWLGISILV